MVSPSPFRRALIALLLLPALLVPGGWRACLCVCDPVLDCGVEVATGEVPERSCCLPAANDSATELARVGHDCRGCRQIDVKPIDTARPGHDADTALELSMLDVPRAVFDVLEPPITVAQAAIRGAAPPALRTPLRLPLRI